MYCRVTHPVLFLRFLAVFSRVVSGSVLLGKLLPIGCYTYTPAEKKEEPLQRGEDSFCAEITVARDIKVSRDALQKLPKCQICSKI